MTTSTRIRPITMHDFDEILAFWRGCPGLVVGESDTQEKFELYLRRNPSTNFLAEAGGSIAGTALAGHDGRRGTLRHVAVRPELRRQGLATQLVEKCLEALRAEGIERSYAIVVKDNDDGQAFWEKRGWSFLEGCLLYARGEVKTVAGPEGLIAGGRQ